MEQNSINIPELLCIGHCCHDLKNGEYILGGAASYASLAAIAFGYKAAILTSIGANFKFHDFFKAKGIEIFNKPAAETTVFQNIYRGEIRTQYLLACAEKLYAKDLPSHLAKAKTALFSTIANEVNFEMINAFPNALKGAIIQGWLRQWDENGRIFPKEIDWSNLKGLDIAFLSDADIRGFEIALPQILKIVPMVVITKGKYGADIYHNNSKTHFPSYPIEEVDPTGAGDVFAAAFLLHFQKTKDIVQAAAFAHSAASLVVEAKGIELPNLEEVKWRMEEYLKVKF